MKVYGRTVTIGHETAVALAFLARYGPIQYNILVDHGCLPDERTMSTLTEKTVEDKSEVERPLASKSKRGLEEHHNFIFGTTKTGLLVLKRLKEQTTFDGYEPVHGVGWEE